MIDFGGKWASAHDWEQILFMSLAPRCLDRFPEFRKAGWLQDWEAYWVDHKMSHANGCTDIALDAFLDSQEKVAIFRRFLAKYDTWLSGFGESIPTEVINEWTGVKGITAHGPCEVSYLKEFTGKVRALLAGDVTHPAVNTKDSREAEQSNGGDAERHRAPHP
jgi:hypothetical protein